MGGDLTAAPKDKSPSFLIRATKDSDGANLDRVQVIKDWRSEDGELHERNAVSCVKADRVWPIMLTDMAILAMAGSC